MSSMIELCINPQPTIKLKYMGEVRAAKNAAKLDALNKAFERLFNNNPIVLPRGSAITKANVAIEAGFPRTAVNERQIYQAKLISKINLVREIEEMQGVAPESNGVLKPKAKTLRQKEILRSLYLALNRIIDNETINIPKGSTISQCNVALEAGFGASHLTTRNPMYAEICADIRKAKVEQEFQKKKDSSVANIHTLSGTTAALRHALGRLETNTPQVIRKGSAINMHNVCIEAGLHKDFLKTNHVNFKSLIQQIEEKEITRQSQDFIQAIERLKEGEPKRLNCRGKKLDIHTVAIEAGYPRNYLECYKSLFSDVISKISFKRAKKVA